MYDSPAYVTLQPFAYIFLQLGKMGQKHEVKKKKKKKHGHNAAGGWYAVSVLHTGQYICSPERGGGHWLVNLVLMLEQKTMRKGTFYQGGQCAAPSSFRIRKTAF